MMTVCCIDVHARVRLGQSLSRCQMESGEQGGSWDMMKRINERIDGFFSWAVETGWITALAVVPMLVLLTALYLGAVDCK